MNKIYNVACGESTTLNQLVSYLTEYLCEYDKKIVDIAAIYDANRVGHIPHPLASIKKVKQLLNYKPQYSLKEAVKWYWESLQLVRV